MPERYGFHLTKYLSRQRQSEVTGNICAAAFTHDASRALDPQLHTHFVIANARVEGSGGSSAALSPIEPDSGHAYKSSLNAFPGMNLIVLLASILTCARVLD
jgi:conjugative relaxase-like TrwC/TraI family protein